jgi:hypothetical protein
MYIYIYIYIYIYMYVYIRRANHNWSDAFGFSLEHLRTHFFAVPTLALNGVDTIVYLNSDPGLFKIFFILDF